MRQRWILHADMDAFFASVEQRDDPSLRGRPVIVGASSPRGVVAAASYEARVFGVRSAMPGFEARRRCPDGVFLGGNMEKYATVSAQVHEVLGQFSSELEPLALDEAFLDISGSVQLFGGPEPLGRELKRRVRQAVDLPISVGLAPNKLVAKLACTAGKPDGLKLVRAEDVRAFLAPMPVRKLWGVGPVLERALLDAGFQTLADLADAASSRLEAVVGERAAELRALAAGIDERPVVSDRAPKSIGEESTFEDDVSDPQRIRDALAAHADAVARRLHRAGYSARTITLRIKLARARGARAARTHAGEERVYPLLSRSMTLKTPTQELRVIRDAAQALWDATAVDEPVRLLGISASKLVAEHDASPLQLGLFDAPQRPLAAAASPAAARVADRQSELTATLDAIRSRFGADSIALAVPTLQKVTHGVGKKPGER